MSKLIAVGLYWLFGLPTCVLGIMSNYDNWKGNVLFALSAIFLLFRIATAVRKEYQRYREKEMDLRQKKDDMDQKLH